MCNLCTPSRIVFLYFLLSPDKDLSTVRQFLWKQTQLKFLAFGKLQTYIEDADEFDINSVKVLKFYSEMAS